MAVDKCLFPFLVTNSITDIVTLSPLLTNKTALTTVANSGGRESSITVSIGRPGGDTVDDDIMCFYAVQSNG